MKILLAAAAAILSTPAMAESWYYIGDTDEGIYFADADSLAREGNVAKFTDFDGNVDGDYAKETIEIDCALNQYRTANLNVYDDGRNLTSSDSNVSDWNPIKAGTVAQDERAFACDGKRNNQVANPFDEADDFWDS